MAKILILNGPNLNLLGTRETLHYGHESLEKLTQELTQYGKQLGHDISCFQSNSESKLIDRIQLAAKERLPFLIFNPAAYTHTSIALRDAILATQLSFIEIHLSNVYKREAFRQHSYFSDIAKGVIVGLGAKGYFLALDAAHHYLTCDGEN
jgi:3-dehydroquinate dehydratase II